MAETSDVRIGKGYGFLTEEGKLYLIRCFDCGRENYGPNVPSGCCSWCPAIGINHPEYGKIYDAWADLEANRKKKISRIGE